VSFGPEFLRLRGVLEFSGADGLERLAELHHNDKQ